MNLLKSKILFSFGTFTQSPTNNIYNAVEFAWPVRGWECCANKIESGSLDALASTVLELLNLEYLTPKVIADDLGISEELLNHIIKQEFVPKGYCEPDKKTFKVTDAGKNYLTGVESNYVQEQKVFGYMFQSLIDGEFFPFFYEGALPSPWRNKDDLFYLDSKSRAASSEQNDTTELQNKINRAYHKYGYIYQKTKEATENSSYDESFFVDADDDIAEQDFDFEEAASNDSDEKKTVELKNLRNARIKLLNTPPKEIYIKFKLCCLKDELDFFQINSPFEENATKWYSEVFARMRNNPDVLFGKTENEMQKLNSYCDSVSNQMFIDIPELKEMKPEEYLKRTYPEIFRSTLSEELKQKYFKLIRQEILQKNYGNNEDDILINMYRILEFMLKKYIQCTDHNSVVNDYFNIVNEPSEIEAIKIQFKIPNGCEAFDSEIKKFNYDFRKTSLMKGFRNQKLGNSLRDKYYYLTFDAYNRNSSGFKSALLKDGNIIQKLDLINQARNKFGGHDGRIDREAFEKAKEYFKDLSSILIGCFDK